MKNSLMFLSIVTGLILLSSCSQEEALSEEEKVDFVTIERRQNPGAQAIVLAAPSVDNDYYQSVFQDIVDFQVHYANEINGRDEVLILVDKKTRSYYEGRVPDFVLVEANIDDIWIRDFSPVVAGRQTKFDFKPDYMSISDANYIDNSFERWYQQVGLEYGKKSSLILDGGNVVDNGNGKVIVTDRFLYDNPHLTKKMAKNKLKKLLNANQVAIIKESPGDATGHADGMVMWVEDNKILLQDQALRVKNKIIRELKTSFPGVELIIVPDYYEFDEWGGFSSACNIYVNALVTNNYIYVPTFNDIHDREMLDFIQSHTSKEVVEIPAEKVCFMGGSVRCLSWQLDGVFADDILTE